LLRYNSWLGGNFVDDFAKGNPDAKWEARFNVNVGYYFLELNIILGVSNFQKLNHIQNKLLYG
jgi:hypothetical protein